MRLGFIISFFCALLLHAAVLLLGGLPFKSHAHKVAKIQEVELVGDVETKKEEKPKEEPEPEEKPEEQVQNDDAPPPDAAQVVRNLEVASAAEAAPELEAASLSAIEAALSGQYASGGDFAEGLSFASGGRIGGKGKAGGGGQEVDEAFNMAEIDQKPRVLYQAAPNYPSTVHGVQGTVTLIFVVDESGRVLNPRVEKTTHPDFEKPALDAIRQWRFEPATKGGKKVAAKMRIPIRFEPKA